VCSHVSLCVSVALRALALELDFLWWWCGGGGGDFVGVGESENQNQVLLAARYQARGEVLGFDIVFNSSSKQSNLRISD
jgi:hypothetical protein